MEKTLFGLQGAQLFVTCTHMAIRGHKNKDGSIKQVLDMKLEALTTPENMVGSPYIDSAFEVTPLPKGKQDTIKGAPPAPKAKYQARPGSSVNVNENYKEFYLLFNNNNGDLMEIVNENSMLPIGDQGLVMRPEHGITWKVLELDTNKKTGSPTAKLIFMVKGLPTALAAIPWREFKQFEIEGVHKTETEINAEVKEKKAAKSAKGQDTVPDPE